MQEQTKWIFWKTAFKKFQGIWSAYPLKRRLSQNLLSPLLNILPQLQIEVT